MTVTTSKVPSDETRPLWQLLFGIIDKPAETFRSVVARHKWWMWATPILLLAITMAISIVVQLPYTLEMTREQAQQQLAQMPPEQAEAARQQMEMFLSPGVMFAQSFGGGIIFLIVALLVQATYLYFSAMLMGGDETRFGEIFTMSAWTRLPMAINFIVLAVFTYMAQQLVQPIGLAMFVTTGDLMQDIRNPLIVFLSQIDIFWLWQLLLMVIGMSVVAKLSRVQSIIVTLIYAILALSIFTVPTLFLGT